MKIIVCYKVTPEAEGIEVKPDGEISLAKAEWKIGQYDLNAIEAGVALAESAGGEVAALSVGASHITSSKAKKAVLSRGPQELYQVVDDCLESVDTNLTARILAAAVRMLGEVDLVLCGEGSSDLYFQQVGLQLGELLGYPTTNAVSKIEVDGDGLIIERSLENDVETLEVSLPAVLSVTTDINLPRLPSMKDILGAGKKPVTEWSLDDLNIAGELESQVEIINVSPPPSADRKNIKLEGSTEEAVAELINLLNKEGVI